MPRMAVASSVTMLIQLRPRRSRRITRLLRNGRGQQIQPCGGKRTGPASWGERFHNSGENQCHGYLMVEVDKVTLSRFWWWAMAFALILTRLVIYYSFKSYTIIDHRPVSRTTKDPSLTNGNSTTRRTTPKLARKRNTQTTMTTWTVPRKGMTHSWWRWWRRKWSKNMRI